jgi:hypothetical protein
LAIYSFPKSASCWLAIRSTRFVNLDKVKFIKLFI